jgi:hypothetical protein
MALVLAGDREPRLEPGWVAFTYGMKVAAPVVSVVAEGAPAARFATLVVPLADGDPVPTLRMSHGAAEVRGAVRDVVRWGARPRDLALGPLRCRAAAGWMRVDASGHTLTARAAGVDGAGRWLAWDAGAGTRGGGAEEL